MRNYAYGIMVRGQKRIGGTMHADSMEDAVLRIARRDGLTVYRKPDVIRPMDNAVIGQAEWMYKGEKASVYVWAPPEYFDREGMADGKTANPPASQCSAVPNCTGPRSTTTTEEPDHAE